jgi:heme/copper-type cytochrome/quinol oxidase subunit 4
MELEKDESGFYFGTTSIGYVLAIVLVIIPVCILVVKDILSMWLGVGIGIIGSIMLCTLLYPFMLCWVIMLYFIVQAEELPKNSPEP